MNCASITEKNQRGWSEKADGRAVGELFETAPYGKNWQAKIIALLFKIKFTLEIISFFFF